MKKLSLFLKLLILIITLQSGLHVFVKASHATLWSVCYETLVAHKKTFSIKRTLNILHYLKDIGSASERGIRRSSSTGFYFRAQLRTSLRLLESHELIERRIHQKEYEPHFQLTSKGRKVTKSLEIRSLEKWLGFLASTKAPQPLLNRTVHRSILKALLEMQSQPIDDSILLDKIRNDSLEDSSDNFLYLTFSRALDQLEKARLIGLKPRTRQKRTVVLTPRGRKVAAQLTANEAELLDFFREVFDVDSIVD